ncbi:Ger(x)C family spore germination protein [Clostridium fermenticellae]|uniref:Ger(x)C family spore germination protein n=1 Tax=Clostridium fermenticellae TaxID=2068654 RepID=UPI001FA9CAF3|nr:Ger(x)C family spore germination protein [Clostridium fermenticellae]
MKKVCRVICLLLIAIVSTGCWDKVEINQKGFVSVMGIDSGDDIGKDKELKKLNPNEPYTGMDLKRIHVTFGLPDISKLGPEKGGIGEDNYIDSDAYSMQDAISKASNKTSREITFTHIKLLMIGSNLLTYPETFKEVIDYLQRQPALDRMMYVCVAQGKAEEFVKYKPTTEKSLENYMVGLIENSRRNNTFVIVTLNDFLKLLDQNGNSISPSFEMDKDKKELKVSGSAIIKNYGLKGFLTNNQTSNIKILRGEFKGGTKVVYKNGHPIDFEVDNSRRKIIVKNTNNKLVFYINVNLEGEIKDSYMKNQLFSANNLSTLEDNFNRSIQKECEQTVQITQDQFQVDPIGFREYLEKYYPRLWSQVENDWDNAYKNAEVHVVIDSKIRRIGAVK